MKRVLFQKTVSLCVIVALLGCGSSSASEEGGALFPPIEPYDTGFLKVSELHKLYWEVCGNEEGVPVMVLHGGPGASANPNMRRFFDPGIFKIILFDQRGAGRSIPRAEWKENTTLHLVEDINKIRDRLGIKGKAMLFGGSWGTTLALAYAQAYPENVSGMVLRGVFTGSKEEIDHFYHGGTSTFYPDNFAKLKSILPRPEIMDYPAQLFSMTQSKDAAVREKAIKGWAYYELRLAGLSMDPGFCERIINEYDMTAFSVLENHYMMNGCFFKDGQLLENAGTIAHVPTFIVNGRYDIICPPATAFALASRLDVVKLEITIAGHSQNEPVNTEALVRGVEWVLENAGKD